MDHSLPVEESYIAVRDIPARSIIKLLAAIAAGAGAISFFVPIAGVGSGKAWSILVVWQPIATE